MPKGSLPYSRLVEAYDALEATTKRLELTDILVELYRETPVEDVVRVTYLNQGKLYPDYLGVEVGLGDRMVVRAISAATGLQVGRIESLYREKGDLGTAAEEASSGRVQSTLFPAPLTVSDVYSELDSLAHLSGSGSQDAKLRSLASLLNRATPREVRYLVRMTLGQLRLGVADFTILDALALAYTGDRGNRPALERAYNISSDLGAVAKAVAQGGLRGLGGFGVVVGRPIRPMLAERLSSAEEIVAEMGGKCAAEFKYDGERMQIHKSKGRVTLFSRRLEVITQHYPDAVKLAAEKVRAKEAILECEGVAVDPDSGELLPFQELMHRRRKYGIEEMMARFPVSLFFFDVMYADGVSYLDAPYQQRRKELEAIVERSDRTTVAPALVTDKPAEIEAFMEEAIQEGCEGLVVKDLSSPYKAGARAFGWIKLKREYRSELSDTLDLVVVGAFYGRGRRAGTYGAYLLAAYDKADDSFETVCKVGTGFSDADLEAIPKKLKPLIMQHVHPRVVSKMEADVWFVPQLVFEVIASEITLSPIHVAALGKVRPGAGLALRFPKFTGKVRDDKSPEDATTTAELLEMYNSQLKKISAKEKEGAQ
ncbi:MAG TPA: ATP-dependent DNA ligase [Conexivisphaerales archaeon]|nr:ATP-dependent DNA ligase [Conexivisphaerales archaeon]